jgi:hypothetical protein
MKFLKCSFLQIFGQREAGHCLTVLCPEEDNVVGPPEKTKKISSEGKSLSYTTSQFPRKSKYAFSAQG